MKKICSINCPYRNVYTPYLIAYNHFYDIQLLTEHDIILI